MKIDLISISILKKEDTHKKHTIVGLKWNVLNQAFSSIVTISVSIILMRLLGPEKFGLIGMVMVFVGFLAVFKNFGMGSSIIQKNNISEIDKNTVFWASLGLGLILTVLLVASSKLIGSFYKNEFLAPITMLLSINFTLGAIYTVHNAMLVKSMDFKRIFVVNFFSVSIAGALAIYMAFKGYGVWALVAQQITMAAVSILIYFWVYPWFPKFQFSKKALRIHLNYSLPLVGNQIVNYWVRNADNLLIGRYLGETSLGLYSRSYALMLVPVSKVSGVISQVMFPSFSQINSDKERVKNVFSKMTRLIALVTFPSMIFLHIIAEQFVHIFLGKEWLAAIFLIKVLSLLGAMQSIGTLVGIIFTSQGATKLLFKMNIILGPILIAFIVAGVLLGLKEVVVFYAVGSLIIFIPQLHITGRIIGFTLVDYIKNLFPVFLSSTIFYVVMFFINYSINGLGSYFLQLIIATISAVLIYLFLLKYLHSQELKEVKQLLKLS